MHPSSHRSLNAHSPLNYTNRGCEIYYVNLQMIYNENLREIKRISAHNEIDSFSPRTEGLVEVALYLIFARFHLLNSL